MMSDELHGLVDTHAHLSKLGERGIDEAARLTQLIAGGFAGIVDIGTDVDDLPQRLVAFSRFAAPEYAARGFYLRFSAGLWPSRESIAAREEYIARLEAHIDGAPPALIAAIGECGLDRRENPEASAAEAELFEMQLDLAARKKIPIIVHSREAPRETLESITKYPAARGIIHCFSYTAAEARAFLDCGYYISFAGNCTFKNAPLLREALALVPDDRLLLETDCPFLAPVPHRGETCEPGMVAATYETAAAVRGIGIAKLIEMVRKNAAEAALVPGE